MKINVTYRLLLCSLLLTAFAVESARANTKLLPESISNSIQESPASVQAAPVATTWLGSGNTVKQAAIQEYAAKNAHGEQTAGSFVKDYLQGKLQLGTRMAYRILTDSESGQKGGRYGSGTFLGTIYALDEQQDYLPGKMFLAYFFTKHFGVEFAYDSMKAETVATDSDTGMVKTDGDVILSGPTVSLLGKYPNAAPFTPYAGIGLGFLNGDFDETADWAHSDWGGSDRNRMMVVDSTTALLLTAGVNWAFDPHWLFDCSLQYVRADADAVFYGATDGIVDTEQAGHFPLDNVALRLGVIYSF
ncbi:MAG: hypothetical protein ACD_75C00048G0008 [uncultured bacterium]|nr:MAG: hypothetical protein ACD_75C00048G0008 [uncultured bacterium]